MSADKSLGKIIWWSERDENGVLTDSKGNEYYFDRSVIPNSQKRKLIKGSLVLFVPTRCDGILTAKNVSLPRASSVGKYQEQFIQESLQLSMFQVI
jgi:hypothetical protein